MVMYYFSNIIKQQHFYIVLVIELCLLILVNYKYSLIENKIKEMKEKL